nr:hypothetical protein [Streptomyces sp. MST-110588]
MGRAAALDEAAPIVANIKNSSIQHESAVQLAGMLGILDTQFVVRRVGQLARWARERGRDGQGGQGVPGGRQAPSRTAGGPGGPYGGSGGSGGPYGRRDVPDQASGYGPSGGPSTYGPSGNGGPSAGRSGPALNLRSPAHRVERELLKLALQRPDLVSPAFDAYGADEFTAPPYAVVRRCIEEAGGAAAGAGDGGYLARVREAAPDDTVRALVTELAVEPLHTRKEPDEAYAGVQLVAVRLAAVNQRVTEIRGALQRLGPNADPEHLTAVQNELWVLQQYGQSLRERGFAAL